ncbi:MAG: sugar phosphate isomerase/epimerase [Bacteroidales bacterium]|nr:sugar phosphate isomerase/epimerase [Bacteroidales bacterium]
MKTSITRRRFIQAGAVAGAAAITPRLAMASANEQKQETANALNRNPLKIGLMTYLLGSKWDIETIIKNCYETGFQSVELRTTHAHGVEVTLSQAQRAEVKKRFKDSPLETISLASAFQYHSPDLSELKKNIEGTKEYILLARDLGATGIRVFPNALPEGVPVEKTKEQIGKALAEVGTFGNDYGIEIRVCIHGSGTNSVPVIKQIIDYSQSPFVYVNWNCNASDTEGEGLVYNFNSVKDRIRGVHMHDLHDPAYPYRHFFKLLADSGFSGYCNAEIGRVSCEPVEYMKCYRGLFLALQNAI